MAVGVELRRGLLNTLPPPARRHRKRGVELLREALAACGTPYRHLSGVVRRALPPLTDADRWAVAAMVVLGVSATIGENLIGPGHDYRETVSVWFRAVVPRGGSTGWFHGVVPLSPGTSLTAGAPLVHQAHALDGFPLPALRPFTRPVHVRSASMAYLWRPYGVHRRRAGTAPAPRPAPDVVRDRAPPPR
ncbi:respiratory nitrate reductase subunit gamma [Kineococcus sp. SYSU DK018]|uniref:respiratory nitrate reductase subunit gamma n=1 Tax=Kineococcus sp. SYSU DK018 TaxID=3383139 RepID=UPI003D7C7207